MSAGSSGFRRRLWGGVLGSECPPRTAARPWLGFLFPVPNALTIRDISLGAGEEEAGCQQEANDECNLRRNFEESSQAHKSRRKVRVVDVVEEAKGHPNDQEDDTGRREGNDE